MNDNIITSSYIKKYYYIFLGHRKYTANIFFVNNDIQVHLNKLECRGKVNLFQ